MKKLNLLSKIFLLFGFGAFAQNLEIYVSDAGNFNNPPWQILKYDQNGQNPQVFIDEELGWPQDIVFLENQNEVLISNLTTNRITRHDIATGDYISDFATVSGGPTRMKIGADNLLYVLQWSLTDNKVKRYQLDGTFVDEFTSVGVPRSIGMDWDSNGNLYVSSFNGGNVRKFNPSGNDMGLFVDAELQGPTNIRFDANDNLMVLDWSGGNVERFDATGNYLGEFIPGLSQPEGIAALPNGNLLIGNGGNGSVKLYDGAGNFIQDLIAPGSGGLIQPNAVVFRDPSLSINESNKKMGFVFPTVGETFHIRPGIFETFGTIRVFSTTGELVRTINPQDTIWNASALQEGVYFLVGLGKNEKEIQKIVVRK